MSRSEMKTGNNLSFQQTANFFFRLGARMKILLLIICSALISSGIGYKDYSQWKLSYFSIEMESSAGGMSQIFFDKGQGLQEQDSISLQVEHPGFQKYLFPIPESIKLIRFDPLNVTSLVSIKNAGIENGTGDKLKVFPLHSFKAIQQIDRFDLNKDVLTIQTIESADDPITVIDDSSFQRKKNTGIDFLAQYGWTAIGNTILIFAVFVGLGALWRQKSSPLLQTIFKWIDLNSYLLTFSACWILLSHRAFSRITSAHLWAEDGPIFISEFINQGFGSFFNQYAGYFHTIPRIFGAAAVAFPVELWPQIIALLSLTTAAATFAIFVSDDFRDYVDKKIVRFCLCLTLCLSPGLSEILSNLANLHWIIFLAATLLILKKAPLRLTFEAPLLFLFFVSAGECLVLLPLLVFRGWQTVHSHKPRQWFQIEFLLAITLIISSLLNFFQRQHNNKGEIAELSQMIHSFDYTVLSQIFYISVLGSNVELWIHETSDSWIFMIVSVTIMAGCSYFLLRTKKDIAINLLLAGACTIGIIFLIWIVRPESINFFPPTQSIEFLYSMRYSFILFPISLIFWLTLINVAINRYDCLKKIWPVAIVFLFWSALNNPAPYRIEAYGDRLWTKDAARLIDAYKSRCFDDFYVRIYPNDWRLHIAKQGDGC
ncbi:hypothetical protein OAR43_09460 [Gammaproteobacteria bacterium]|nr:hypothetical protein [Gammaproteobacteria bacterium]